MIGVVNLLVGFLLLLLGVITRFVKAGFLIAGYNTLSKEEKAKYDKERLTGFVGNMLIVSSLFLLIGGLLTVLTNINPLSVTRISWVLFLIVIVVGVIHMNTGNRFKK